MLFKDFKLMEKKYTAIKTKNAKYIFDFSLLENTDSEVFNSLRQQGIFELLINDYLDTHGSYKKFEPLIDFNSVHAKTSQYEYFASFQFEITNVFSRKDWKRKYLFYRLIGIDGYWRSRSFYATDVTGTFHAGKILKSSATEIREEYITERSAS